MVSAADPSKVWDLRCEVREKLLAFLQTTYPESLRERGETCTSARGNRNFAPPDSKP